MTIYKSSRGTPVDMNALIKQHEKVRAVSNISANARGDIIDSQNKVVIPVNQRVSEKYKAETKIRNVVSEARTQTAPQSNVSTNEAEKQQNFKAQRISADPVEMEELTAEERALEEELGEDNE